MGMFQTIGSNERYGILEVSRQRTLAATGSGQSDAALIGANVSIVTGATGSNGVLLRKPRMSLPYIAFVYSSAATNALLIYPPSGGTINNGSTNAAFSAVARKPVQLVCISGDGLTWVALQGA